MKLQVATNDVLRAVEEATGKPVIVQTDPSLGTLLAKITMARGAAAAHIVAVNPAAEATVDYVICFQCGFLLRTFRMPEDDRFSLGVSARARNEAERLTDEHLAQNGLHLDKAVRASLPQRFLGGIIQQLRSMPVGLRVDAWLQQRYPALAEQQKVAVNRQINDNAAALRPDIGQMVPALILRANIGMNAAFAMFWSRMWNDPLLSVPYKSSGRLALGEQLLDLFDRIPDDSADDRKLIDAWGSHVGLAGWYEFVPYK